MKRAYKLGMVFFSFLLWNLPQQENKFTVCHFGSMAQRKASKLQLNQKHRVPKKWKKDRVEIFNQLKTLRRYC